MIGYHLIPTMKVYTAKVTRRGQTTIPAPLRKRHGIEEGSRVEFREHGRTLVQHPHQPLHPFEFGDALL